MAPRLSVYKPKIEIHEDVNSLPEKFHASSSSSSAADHVVLSKKEDFPRALSVPRVGAAGSKSEWLGFN